MTRVFAVPAKLAVSVAVLVIATAAFAAEGEFHRTLKVTGPVNLQIETGSGSISVHTGSASCGPSPCSTISSKKAGCAAATIPAR